MINAISPLNSAQASLEGKEISAFSDNDSTSPSFSQLLGSKINEVNQLLTKADQAAQDLAVGRTENIHEAMISAEKAETGLKLLMQMRNKAIDAYHEIMRMQL